MSKYESAKRFEPSAATPSQSHTAKGVDHRPHLWWGIINIIHCLWNSRLDRLWIARTDLSQRSKVHYYIISYDLGCWYLERRDMMGTKAIGRYKHLSRIRDSYNKITGVVVHQLLVIPKWDSLQLVKNDISVWRVSWQPGQAPQYTLKSSLPWDPWDPHNLPQEM